MTGQQQLGRTFGLLGVVVISAALWFAIAFGSRPGPLGWPHVVVAAFNVVVIWHITCRAMGRP